MVGWGRGESVITHSLSSVRDIPRFSTTVTMCADVMTSKFGNITLKISTPKRAAAEDDDDVAVLSSFLPEYLMSAATASKNKAFVCSLQRDCRLGDPRATPPGSP